MIRRPPRSTPFPTRRSSDLRDFPGFSGTARFPRVPPGRWQVVLQAPDLAPSDRKSTRLNSSHMTISYAVFCLKKKKRPIKDIRNEYNYTKKKGIKDDYSRLL